MHLHLRPMRGVDAKGRVHISLDDMAEIYRNFHAALNDTYWETASNHKICTDAMEMLKTTHISKKNGRFLFLFTSVLSEAYSHAHYNIQELLYDNRDEVRASYWSDILILYKAVMAKADKVYSHSKCGQRLALLLHFASLFSLYKDVADEDFIVSLHQLAEEYIANDKHRFTDGELEQIKEYHNAIQTIYNLRCERRQSKSQNTVNEPNEAPTLTIDENDAAEEEEVHVGSPSQIPLSKDELCAIYDNALKRHQKLVLKRQQTLDLEELEDAEWEASELSAAETTTTDPETDSPQTSTSRRKLQSTGQLALIASEAELENAIKNLNSVTVSNDHPSESGAVSEGVTSSTSEASYSSHSEDLPAPSTPVSVDEDLEQHIESLADFDFREEFERRFRERKSPPTTTVDLPVIGRPNKDDIVHNYRRKGLFDNAAYRQPPSLHRIASLDSPAGKSYTAFSFDEMDLVNGGTEEEEGSEPNNNTLTPNTYLTEKIIRAVLAEKPVSPIEPRHRRMSLFI